MVLEIVQTLFCFFGLWFNFPCSTVSVYFSLFLVFLFDCFSDSRQTVLSCLGTVFQLSFLYFVLLPSEVGPGMWIDFCGECRSLLVTPDTVSSSVTWLFSCTAPCCFEMSWQDIHGASRSVLEAFLHRVSNLFLHVSSYVPTLVYEYAFPLM